MEKAENGRDPGVESQNTENQKDVKNHVMEIKTEENQELKRGEQENGEPETEN